MDNHHPAPRPIRLTLVLTLCCAILVAAAAPFVEFGGPLFLLTGITFGLFLSTIAVGIVLSARSSIVRWLLVSTSIPWLGSAVIWVSVTSSVNATDLRGFVLLLRITQVSLLLWLGFACVVATFGWMRFVRSRQSVFPGKV